jgi:hypothetical protein
MIFGTRATASTSKPSTTESEMSAFEVRVVITLSTGQRQWMTAKSCWGSPTLFTMSREPARRQCPPQLAVEDSHSRVIPSKPSSRAPTTDIQPVARYSSRDNRLQKKHDGPVEVGSTKSWTDGVDDHVVHRAVDILVARLQALAVR